MDINTLAVYAAGIIILFIVAKLFLMPIKIIIKLVWNAVLGGALLWLVNLVGGLFGFTIAINWMSALIAGLLGVPGVYAAGIIILFIVAKLFLMPIKIIIKLVWNAVLGGALLWLVNLVGGLFGFTIAINWMSALIAGLLGVPGVILLVIWKLFF